MEKSVSRNKKHKKRRRKVDKISDWPDSVLLRILSFLPTKEAVATSLLSKRWSPLWRSLNNLHFDRESFRRLDFFCGFVDKVFKLADLKSVKKFVLILKCNHFDFEVREHFKPQKISKWINDVISSKVEHLEVWIKCWDAYELPSSVFVANNIRVLKLRGVKVGTLSHNLPLLEVLHLEDVSFPYFRSLEILLSACALLKRLVLKNIHQDEGYNRPLVIGGLAHLVTAEVSECLIPLKVLFNVTFLRLFWTSFSVQDIWSFSDDMPIFHNLTHLECVASGEWTRLVNCLRHFPKLEKLVISEPWHKVNSISPHEPIVDVPPCVSLHMKEFTLRYCQGPESLSEMLQFISENAKFLRTLTILRAEDASEYDRRMFSKFTNDASEHNRQTLQRLATYLNSSTRMHEQPLFFMI